jgi:cation transporter-like permease
VKILRYAGIAGVLALFLGGVAWVSESNLVSFFALLGMNLGLVLAVALLILAVGAYRGPSDPPL